MTTDNIIYCKDYLVELPLPLAQLYDRLYNHSSNINEKHNNGFYLFEALIKLTTITLIAQYRVEIEQNGQREPALESILKEFKKPSLGHWLQILRELTKYFANRTQADGKPHWLARMKPILERKHQRQDSPALLALYCRIKNGVDTPSTNDTSCNLMELFNAINNYRNNVIGHGASRQPEFYASMTPLLMAASTAILNEDMLTPLGMRGAYLIYLQNIEVVSATHVHISYRKLVGTGGEPAATPIRLEKILADALTPKSVAIQFPQQVLPLCLDPLAIYEDKETPAQVLLLNSNHNNKKIEYLNYKSGETIRDSQMVKAVGEMLTKLAGQSVIADPIVDSSGSTAPSRLEEDFELLAEIGRGGMGQVYLAQQKSLGRLVALKMLPDEQADNTVAMARFQQEINTLSQSDHPNIVKVYTHGRLPLGGIFYAMEYLQGVDLAKVWSELAQIKGAEQHTQVSDRTFMLALQQAIDKSQQRIKSVSQAGASKSGGDSPANFVLPTLPQTPLPKLPDAKHDRANYIRHIVSLIRDVARALQSLHQRNIIHRDIKPSNLLLSADGKRLVLTDFGLVKQLEVSRGLSTADDKKGLIGTLRYAAPEQLASASIKISPAVDVRGLGVVLWEMLTLRQVFGELSDEQQAYIAVLNNDLPPLRSIDPSFDKDLEAIVTRATERRCAERIQTAEQLANYLDLYLDGKPLPIRPWTFTEKMIRVGRNHPVKAGLAASVAIALLGAGAYWNTYVRPHHTYYSDISIRNGIFTGRNPLNLEVIEKRIGSWRFTTQGRKGNLTEIAWVNQHGQCPESTEGQMLSLLNPQIDSIDMPYQNIYQELGISNDNTNSQACSYKLKYKNDQKTLSSYTVLDANKKDLYSFEYRNWLVDKKRPEFGCFVSNSGEIQQRTHNGASCIIFTYHNESNLSEYINTVTYTDERRNQRFDKNGIFGKSFMLDELGNIHKTVHIRDKDINSASKQPLEKRDAILVAKYDNSGRIVSIKNQGFNILSKKETNNTGNSFDNVKWGFTEFRVNHDDYGNIQEVSLYDDQDKPAKNANLWSKLKIKRDIQNGIIDLSFYDVYDKPFSLPTSSIHKFRQQYDKSGKKIKELLLDVNDKLLTGHDGVAIKVFAYDKQGRLTEESFFDHNNQPIVNSLGSFKVVYSYDKDNNKASESYYDSNELPVKIKNGYASVKFEYENGNKILEQYFDTNGDKTTNHLGYSQEKLLYDNYNRPIELSFHDKEGSLVNTENNYAIIRVKYNQYGNITESSNYDSNEKPVLDKKHGVHKTRYGYDSKGNKVSFEYFGTDDKLTVFHEGYAKIVFQFNDLNYPYSTTYYDTNNNKMLHADGYATQLQTFNETGNLLETVFYDQYDNLAVSNSNGYAKATYQRDDRGNKLKTMFFNEKNQPTMVQVESNLTNNKAFYAASYTEEYDTFNNIAAQSFLDEKGQPILDNNGCAKSAFEYEKNSDRKSKHECWGANGKLGSNHNIPAITRYKYDSLGNQIEESYYDANDQRMLQPDHQCAIRQWSYDNNNNKETEICFDVNYQPKPDNYGIIKYKYVYNGGSNIIEEHYLDQTNMPMLSYDNDAKLLYTYDKYDRPIKWEHFDTKNQRTLFKHQYSIQEKAYDNNGYPAENKYFGIDENPIFFKEAGYARSNLTSCQFFDENNKLIEPFFNVTVNMVQRAKLGDRIGVQENDIITHYNEIPVISTCQFSRLIEELERDVNVKFTTLKVLRDGKPKTFETLEKGKLGVGIINEVRNPNSESAIK